MTEAQPNILSYQRADYVPDDWTGVQISSLRPEDLPGHLWWVLTVRSLISLVTLLCIVAYFFVAHMPLVEITIIVVICLVFTVISDIRDAKKARAGWSTYRVALADQGLLTISMRTGVTRLMWDQMKCAVEFPRTLCIVTKSGQHLHIARSISAYPTLHSMVGAHIAIERSRAAVVRTVLLTPLGFALLAGPLMAQGLIRDVRVQFLCFGLLIVIHAVVNLRRWRRRILSTRSLNICVILSCVVILASAILLVLSMIAH